MSPDDERCFYCGHIVENDSQCPNCNADLNGRPVKCGGNGKSHIYGADSSTQLCKLPKLPKLTAAVCTPPAIDKFGPIVDSGGAVNVSRDLPLSDVVDDAIKLKAFDGTISGASKAGTATLSFPTVGGGATELVVPDMHEMPSATDNLLSVYHMVEQGCEVFMSGAQSFVQTTGGDRVKLTPVGGQYRLPPPVQISAPIDTQLPTAVAPSPTTPRPAQGDYCIWSPAAAAAVLSPPRKATASCPKGHTARPSWSHLHDRMGHISDKALLKASTYTEGAPEGNVERPPCEACARAAKRVSTGVSHPKGYYKAGEMMHADLMGPTSGTVGLRRGPHATYVALFRDAHSGFEMTYLMAGKDETIAVTRQALSAWKASGLEYPSRVRFDNDFLKRNEVNLLNTEFTGVHFEYSNAREQSQNGIAEKGIQDNDRVKRHMVLAANAPLCFQLYGNMMATQRRNVTPRERLNWKTPLEVLLGEKADLTRAHSALKVPFSKVYISDNVPRTRKDRGAATRHAAMYLGNGQSTIPGKYGERSFRVWDIEAKKMVETSEVFDVQEDVCPSTEHADSYPLVSRRVSKAFEKAGGVAYYDGTIASVFDGHYAIVYDDDDREELTPDEAKSVLVDNAESSLGISAVTRALSESLGSVHPIAKEIASRVSTLPLGEAQASYALSALQDLSKKKPDSGLTLRAAMLGSSAQQWTESLDKELDKLNENDSFDFVDRMPPGALLIHTKVVLKIKSNGVYKCRLVVLGNRDPTAYGQGETYAPVGDWSSMRGLLAFACCKGFPVKQFDWNSAFTQARLKSDRDIYIRFPDHCKWARKLARLKSNLYGLKTAPKTWYDEVRSYVVSIGFVVSDRDPCIFSRGEGSDRVLLGLYVDDLLCVPASEAAYTLFRDSIMAKYDIDEMGQVADFLRMTIAQDLEAGTLSISAEKYVRDTLVKFGYSGCTPVSSPDIVRESSAQLHNDRISNPELYGSIVGALTYLASVGRPDIAMSVSLAAQHLKDPTPHAWAIVDRVLRYLSGSADKKITYQAKYGLELQLYCDADGQDHHTRQPRIGTIFTVAGAPIYWRSHLAPIVTASVCESELFAISEIVKTAISIVGVLKFIGFPMVGPVVIRSDNQGAIFASQDDSSVKRLKHFDIRYKFVLQFIRDGTFKTVYCRTEYNLADVLTKPMTLEAHRRFVGRLVQ